MFEVNLFSPHQFGAFAAWLAVWRGGLSVLVHPNTVEVVDGKEVRSERLDHTERAIWMGKRLELKMEIFDWIEAKEKEEEEKKTVQAQGQAAL
jgi:DOPA 4,5-dioxygenase